MCHTTAGVVGVCGECLRVSHVVIDFTPEGILIRRGSKFVVFHTKFDPPIFTTILGKMKSENPEHREKKKLEISGAQGQRATLYVCPVTDFMQVQSVGQWSD